MMLLFIFLQNNVFKYPVNERYNATDATIEILVMLFIAVLLGFLLRHFLGYSRKKEIIVSNNPGETDTQQRVYTEAEMNAIVQESLNKYKVTLIDHIKHDPSVIGLNTNQNGIVDTVVSTNDKKSKTTQADTTAVSVKKTEPTTKTTPAVETKKETTTPPATIENKAPIAKKEIKVDDLKRIEGIGPAIEKLLNSHQIFSFSDLANKDLAILDKILDDAGPRFRVHVPETWTKQASLLNENKIAEFEQLTKELKGGRVKK